MTRPRSRPTSPATCRRSCPAARATSSSRSSSRTRSGPRPTRSPTTAAAPPEITHLARVGRDGGRAARQRALERRLEIIPTKADYVLDLIRANSLWPLLSGLACCAIEMMSAATSKNDMDRWGMFPFRREPAPGRRPDRRRHAHDEDGRAAAAPLGADAGARSGASRWATARCRAGATSAATPRSRGSTGSCRSTSTCPAARRVPRASSSG